MNELEELLCAADRIQLLQFYAELDKHSGFKGSASAGFRGQHYWLFLWPSQSKTHRHTNTEQSCMYVNNNPINAVGKLAANAVVHCVLQGWNMTLSLIMFLTRRAWCYYYNISNGLITAYQTCTLSPVVCAAGSWQFVPLLSSLGHCEPLRCPL